ncbi:MAG: DUF3761 domain-containing protein [Gemmatimonadetes bacterium]|nr:DUF3761 domain-containing protein [Gemmatimonadota bacterium]
MLVHDAPDGNATVARILQAGDRVEIEATGPSAWVTVFDEPGHRIGYSFRTRQNLLPTRPRLPPPTDTTALCTDGTSSFSVHASGTCSQHGGVLCWRSHPDPQPVRVSKPYCRSFPADHQEDS